MSNEKRTLAGVLLAFSISTAFIGLFGLLVLLTYRGMAWLWANDWIAFIFAGAVVAGVLIALIVGYTQVKKYDKRI